MMKKEYTFLNYLATLMVFAFASGGSLLNPAIQTMANAFPELPASTIRLVTTLPAIVSLPIMLAIGAYVGKKISYRFCAIFGTLMIAVFGVAPYFFSTSWTLVLAFRALVGIGAGLVVIRNGLVLNTLPPEKRTAYLGYGSVVNTVVSAAIQTGCGALAEISWRHAFLVDAFALVAVIYMVFFLREPEIAAQEEETVIGSKDPGDEKIGWKLYFYIIFQFLSTLFLFPLITGISTFMDNKAIGGAAMAGLAITIYQFSGSAANMVMNTIQNALKRYTLGVSCILIAAGLAILTFLPTRTGVFVGVIVAGAAYYTAITMLQVYNGQMAPKSRMNFISAVILTMIQLAIFVSNYYITICHVVLKMQTEVESSFVASIVLYVILGVICILVNVAPNPDEIKK